MIRILVAEDSPAARELLLEVLRSDRGLEVIGHTNDGVDAVAMTARLRPDVVTMDIHLPSMDGFAAIRGIMARCPTPTVIVSGEFDTADPAFVRNSLRAGAVAILPRLPGVDAPEFDHAVERLLRTIKAAAATTMSGARARSGPLDTGQPSVRGRGGVLVIPAGGSGQDAIKGTIAALPGDLAVPVLLTHPRADRVAMLCDAARLPVKEAQAGQDLLPGTVYLVPADQRPGVDPGQPPRLSLRDAGAPREMGEGSHLLESAADVFGEATTVLFPRTTTEDLTAGLFAVRLAGGRVIAYADGEDAAPVPQGAALATSLADAIVTPDLLARELQVGC